MLRGIQVGFFLEASRNGRTPGTTVFQVRATSRRIVHVLAADAGSRRAMGLAPCILVRQPRFMSKLAKPSVATDSADFRSIPYTGRVVTA